MSKFCFATVTDENFVVAAEVLIHSFIKFNSWFDGDIVIIQVGELLESSRNKLQNIYPVKFVTASNTLLTKLDQLQKQIPWLKNKFAHFHVFELFRLTEYDHIVYVDGDTYCCGDISNLFVSKNKIQACPDGFNFRIQLWDELGDLAPEVIENTHPYGKDIVNSFNSGVLAISKKQISQKIYNGLLGLLNSDIYQDSNFGDQMAFNIYFKDNFTPLSGKYNYMILVEEYIKGLEDITSLEARIIHFAGKIKPWYNYDANDLFKLAPQYVKYIDAWHELYQQCQNNNNSNKDNKKNIAKNVSKQRLWSRQNLAKIDSLKTQSLL